MHIPTFVQYGNLVNKVIILFLCIVRVLIYLFLMLSNTIIFTFCLATQTYPSHLGCLHPLWFYFTSLTHTVLLKLQGFHVIIYLDDILVLSHKKNAGKRAQTLLCSLLVYLGLHWITSSNSALFFFRTTLGYSGYVCSLPSFLGKTTFCTSGHAQLYLLSCHSESNVECLSFFSSFLSFFSPIPSRWHQLWRLSVAAVLFLYDFLFLMWLLLQMLPPIIWSFIVRVLGFPYPAVNSGLVHIVL